MTETILIQERVIRAALEEDIGAGDLTTDMIVDPILKASATVIAREELVLAGIRVFTRVFEILSREMSFVCSLRDGQTVQAGSEICSIAGPAQAILTGERTALNFLQRMCGIASLTRKFVDQCGSRTRILDTRKTAPGLRPFDKYAVRMGGGFNHRFGLYDGILIKDNHITAAGSIREAVSSAIRNSPHTLKVEVEVEDLAGLREAIEAGADAVLLDNMGPELMREAVGIAAGRVLLEASGGIGLHNVGEIAATGVDLISIGALTHSPRAMDISLELKQL